MVRVGRDSRLAVQKRLDLANGNAVLLAVRPVALVPIEKPIDHSLALYECTYKCNRSDVATPGEEPVILEARLAVGEWGAH